MTPHALGLSVDALAARTVAEGKGSHAYGTRADESVGSWQGRLRRKLLGLLAVAG